MEHIDYDPAMTDASWFISTSKFSGGYMNYAKKDKKDTKRLTPNHTILST